MRKKPEKYTQEEINFIKENHSRLTATEIARKLKRSKGNISEKLKKFKLSPFIRHHPQSSLFKENKRQCNFCHNIFLLDNFCHFKNGKNAGKYAYKCKKCMSKTIIAQRNKMYDSINSYSEKIIKIIKCHKERPKCFLSPKDIKNQFNLQKGKCFYSKEILFLAPKNQRTISIDRVDPTKPYQKDNIVLCCYIVNMMKQNLQHIDFLYWCKLVLEGKDKIF